MKLIEWIPTDFDVQDSDAVSSLLDFDIIDIIGPDHVDYKTCPIKRKHIYNWCKVTNGTKTYAVAWNENPALGWSFPIKRIW